MIIAWVLSLLLLMASLLDYLQRMTALEIIATQTMKSTQAEFIAAEEKLLVCERNISNVGTLPADTCVVQSIGKQIWKVSTMGPVTLESVVQIDDASGNATRLSWRQDFKNDN